jgi:single-strand DNA-binding protein
MAGDTTMTVVGNLTDDPDLRFLPSGVAVAKFTVASTPRVLDRESGQWRDGEPLFLTCTAWRDIAEHAAESLQRGTRVVVVGRLRLSRWETDDGEKRSSYGLEVDDLGPSLRFATARVNRMARTRASTPGGANGSAADPWATAIPAEQMRQPATPAPAGAGLSTSDGGH